MASELLESTCDRTRVALLFNPAAGAEDPTVRRAALEDLAHAVGLGCELVETDVTLGSQPAAEQAVADGMERLIVCGGDGSVAEAAHALAGTQTSLAVVPSGTANLLALNLGIPSERAEAMRFALAASPQPTDVARTEHGAFVIAAGMGLDARIMREADRALKDRYGHLAYFIAGWRNLGRPNRSYTITIDGKALHRSAQTVLVANMGRITAGLELVPGSRPDDGLLEIAIIRAQTIREIALLGLRALLGRARSDGLTQFLSGRHVVIEADRPQPVQLDGNDVGEHERLEASVEPGGLLIVRPTELPQPAPAAVVATSAARSWLPPLLFVVAAAAAWRLRRR